MFQKTAKSRLNNFELKFIPYEIKTMSMIGKLILIFLASMLAMAFADKYIFPVVNANVFYAFAAIVIVSAIYLNLKHPRGNHRYCIKALIDLQKWQEIWQDAGLANNDPDMRAVEAKINYLAKHCESPRPRPYRCEMKRKFYSEVNGLIQKINSKVFDTMPY